MLRKRLSTFAAVNETSPPRPMDRTAAYEAADGSSSLPEGTMEPWQRWSMRGTENPENEVRVLGVPPEYMVSVAQLEEQWTVNPCVAGSKPAAAAKAFLLRERLFLCPNTCVTRN